MKRLKLHVKTWRQACEMHEALYTFHSEVIRADAQKICDGDIVILITLNYATSTNSSLYQHTKDAINLELLKILNPEIL